MFSSLLQLAGLTHRWPEFSREEIAAHCTPESLWIVAGNSVYDVTKLLGCHAGGDAALLKRGGGVKDCTEDLYFHGSIGRSEAKTYKIGEICAADLHKGYPGQPSKSSTPSATPPSKATPSVVIRRVPDPSEESEDDSQSGSSSNGLTHVRECVDAAPQP